MDLCFAEVGLVVTKKKKKNLALFVWLISFLSIPNLYSQKKKKNIYIYIYIC